jgi:hypothetical protein
MSASEKQRLLMAIRLLTDSGDLTPIGARELIRIFQLEA